MRARRDTNPGLLIRSSQLGLQGHAMRSCPSVQNRSAPPDASALIHTCRVLVLALALARRTRNDEWFVPCPVDVASMGSVCPHTMHGWLWYCDVHDSHGNADTEDEAWFVATAHEEHRAMLDDAAECELIVWLRTLEERVSR